MIIFIMMQITWVNYLIYLPLRHILFYRNPWLLKICIVFVLMYVNKLWIFTVFRFRTAIEHSIKKAGWQNAYQKKKKKKRNYLDDFIILFYDVLFVSTCGVK